LNDGSDEEEGTPKRPKLRVSASTETISTPPIDLTRVESQRTDFIEPNESASNVNTQSASNEKEESQVSGQSRPKSSFVWKYFEEVDLENIFTDKNGRTIQAVFFKCTLRPDRNRPDYRKSHLKGSTGDLSRHLRDKYFIRKDSSTVDNGDSIAQYMKQGTISTRESTRNKLLQWVGKTAQPFSVVESLEFQELFLSQHDEPLPIKTGNGVKAALQQKYCELVSGRIAKFGLSQGKVALSLDCWTSVTGDSFMAIVCHVISNEFEYSEMLLNFSHLISAHTGNLLAVLVTK
jgi:hypothetical protein